MTLAEVSKYFTLPQPSVAEITGQSLRGTIGNMSVGIISLMSATGTHLWVSKTLIHYFSPDPHTIKDYAINALACISSVTLGSYVGERVGYSSVPAMAAIGVEIDPGWIGVAGAVTAATLATLVNMGREGKPKPKKS